MPDKVNQLLKVKKPSNRRSFCRLRKGDFDDTFAQYATKRNSEQFRLFKRPAEDPIKKVLDYRLFPNQKVQKKIDYFITPYNNSMSLDKHMDFTRRDLEENGQHLDKDRRYKKWNLISKATFNEKNNLLTALKDKPKEPQAVMTTQLGKVSKKEEDCIITHEEFLSKEQPNPTEGNNHIFQTF
ncbi:unnamed protein product [Moneuplotes crassus]|uniref:Uncharacterized protein n=1 Tax=Euplotes crassus TaxID=5936 RepID=A0AAD1UHX2_EUPCR|nr:unnamed protein product [Moneuplotes crassus]